MTRSTPVGFFDTTSGSPLSDVAHQALLQGVEMGWANPSRLHHPGRVANQLLQAARESCANTLGFETSEVVFVQSVPLAFRLALAGVVHDETSVVTSSVEQSFLLNALQPLPTSRCSIIEVNDIARVDVAKFQSAVGGATVAILQLANHEVGTCQPWGDIDFGPPGEVTWVADATVSAGIEAIPNRVDLAIVNPASWGGPSGLAILCVRNRVRFCLQLGLGEVVRDGSSLQRLLGEPNVGLALACAASLEDVASRRGEIVEQLTQRSQQLRDGLVEQVKDVVLLGATNVGEMTPGLVGFSLLYVDGEALLHELAKHDIAVISGSSCVADAVGPSHVLVAMGGLSQGNVRVSIPFDATPDAVASLVQAISLAAKKVREDAGVSSF